MFLLFIKGVLGWSKKNTHTSIKVDLEICLICERTRASNFNFLHQEPQATKNGEISTYQSLKTRLLTHLPIPMASLTPSFCPLPQKHSYIQRPQSRFVTNQKTKNDHLRIIHAAQSSNNRQRAPPGVDTRIHWENEDEGWIGTTKSKSAEEQLKTDEDLDKKFSDLLNSSSDSHYQ